MNLLGIFIIISAIVTGLSLNLIGQVIVEKTIYKLSASSNVDNLHLLTSMSLHLLTAMVILNVTFNYGLAFIF